ncbi:kinase-like protein [Lipomyces oligophaga]|uniref:kinase-like protein n=1 Tax=Lipomyces oligophaga TaxID=45792 RepID=UPI0034CF2916
MPNHDDAAAVAPVVATLSTTAASSISCSPPSSSTSSASPTPASSLLLSSDLNALNISPGVSTVASSSSSSQPTPAIQSASVASSRASFIRPAVSGLTRDNAPPSTLLSTSSSAFQSSSSSSSTSSSVPAATSSASTGSTSSPNPLAPLHSARGIAIHTQIPADVQERIMKFQQSRQQRSNPSTPISPASSGPLSSPSSPLSSVGGSLVGRPARPTGGQGLSLRERRNMNIDSPISPGDVSAGQMASATISARRGPKMRLPPGSMTLPGTSCTPPSNNHDSKGLFSNDNTNNNNNSTNNANVNNISGRPGTRSMHVNVNPGELFASYSNIIDVKAGSLNFAGKASIDAHGIKFASGTSFTISLDDLEVLGELGRGNYGTVSKVLHKPTQVIMAMKQIRLELDEIKFQQILMELDVLHKCVSPYIVDFFGAFFVEGAVYICMEYMDASLDKLYRGGVEESHLAKITESVVRGLKVLKDKHNIIHRDVKPTNILASTSGAVKLCDFGVSGNLVASMARTNVGCQSYMAPERIKSVNPNDAGTYTVQSDIWSLGLSLLEIANGSYPYPPETYGNVFSQLSAIVDGEPPSLPEPRFSHEAASFVKQCLNKDAVLRPTYAKLLAHPWLVKNRTIEVDMGTWVKDTLERSKHVSVDNPSQRPALHFGGAFGGADEAKGQSIGA